MTMTKLGLSLGRRTLAFFACFLLAALLAVTPGCSGCTPRKTNATDASIATPRDPTLTFARTGASACLASADCGAGLYCDLGECIADCDASRPCTNGATCSPRGRCGSDDETPPKPQARAKLVVEPASLLLSRDQKKATLRLKSASGSAVRYRVEVTGAHLSTPAPRGSFSGQTEVAVDVDTAGLTGMSPGVVRIVSTEGEVDVPAPALASVSAHYEGALVYDERPLPLGGSNLVLDVSENAGKVSARIDPVRSLLFPASGGRVVIATGTYSGVDRKMSLTLVHRLEAEFGGERNHFARPIFRRMQIVLDEGVEVGTFAGTFTEEILGLFNSPVTANGKVKLRATGVPAAPIGTSMLPPEPPPTAPGYLSPRDVFAWSGTEGTCFDIARSACDAIGDKPLHDACKVDPPAHTDAIMLATSTPLSTAAGGAGATYTALAGACRRALDATSSSAYTSASATCGRPTALACLLEPIWTRAGNATDGEKARKLYADTVSRMLAPATLVAKDEVVAAVHSSVREGLTAETARYRTALTRLRPQARWVLQPVVLETLRSLEGTDARGGTWPDSRPWGAAIAIGDLLSNLTRVGAELSRVAAATDAGDPTNAKGTTQERAVLTYLEGIAYATLLKRWEGSPPTLGTLVAGSLAPLDRAFVSLLAGDSYFGVPRGFVPFVFDPEQAGPGRATNFEQVMAFAETAIARNAAAETHYLETDRTYRLDASALAHELASVRTLYDANIRAICGPSFDVEGIVDWSRCGVTAPGQTPAGELALIDARGAAAEGQIRVMQARVVTKQNAIAVTERTLQEVLKLRADEIEFRLATGQAIAALTATQGVLRSVIESITVASNAQVWNGGAPLVWAIPVLAMGLVNTGLEYVKDQLRIATEAKTAYTGIEELKLRGVEQLQREWIEVAQLAYEAEEGARALLVHAVERATVVSKAHALYDERARALALIGTDPARDPTVRLVRDRAALDLLEARAEAQYQLWLAARALAFEANLDLPGAEGAVLRATNASSVQRVVTCLKRIRQDHTMKFGAPERYDAELSLRRMMGIREKRKDPVTGVELTEGEQFHRLLVQLRNMDPEGGVTLDFATTLKPPRETDPESALTGFFPSNLCEDQIVSIQAQIDGDSIGDNTAFIELRVDDSNFMRTCGQRQIASWQLEGGRTAVVQVGVNKWDEARVNSALNGRAVAQSAWRLRIPSGQSVPDNADLFSNPGARINDIRLRIKHRAAAVSTGTVAVDCLGQP